MRSHVPESGITFVEANGLTFGCLVRGEGPLVLLFHGFPDTAHTWDHVLDDIAAAGYQAVAPFIRGYAPSGIPERDSDVLTQADDVIGLIDAFGAETATIVGHDWGASHVFAAAIRYPERIDKLVAVAIPHPASIKPSLSLAWSIRHFVSLRLPGAVDRFCADDFAAVDTYYERWSPTWDRPADETESAKNAYAAPGSANAALGYYRAAGLPPRWLLAKVTVPTLSFAGQDDPNLPVSAFESAARWYSGPYTNCALPGGHFVHRESPDAFRTKLLEFLG
ncbi:MAG: alpha/beta hydrolase [Myxococcales bacterium]|nr:alpha/beta hydrolase [Myxococcales bacterium]